MIKYDKKFISLLDNGAITTLQDATGKTALDYAKEKNVSPDVRALLEGQTIKSEEKETKRMSWNLHQLYKNLSALL